MSFYSFPGIQDIYQLRPKSKARAMIGRFKFIECRFYLFRFLDYQMAYYEVLISCSKDYGAPPLRLNPFDLRVDMEGSWLEHSCVIVAGLLLSRGC